MGTSECFADSQLLNREQKIPLLSEGKFPEEEVPTCTLLAEKGREELLVLTDDRKLLKESSALSEGIRL